MELFEINYFDRAMAIFKEAFSFKKYRLMAKPFAVITAIIFVPFQLISLFIGVVMLLSALFLRINFSLTTGWHKVVTDEGQKVKHATQVVIYFFSWPFILFVYVLSGLFLSTITVGYLAFACISYIWTLGGIKFKAFIGDSDDCVVNKKNKYPTAIPAVFTIITASLLAVIPAVAAIVLLLVNVVSEAPYFQAYFPIVAIACAATEYVFATLYSFFGYAKFPKE